MNLSIFPNPFTSKINIKPAGGNKRYELSDCYGQVIFSGSNISSQDFSFLAKGIYILSIIENKTTIIKLAKE